jgi:membrane associated rhomboid family serine protease
VQEGAKTQRVVRTPFVAAVGAKGISVSAVLVVLNIVIYLAEAAGVKVAGQTIETRFELFRPAVAHGDWWRLLTAAFLHGSLLHLAFNMGALAAFGPHVEAAMGKVRFLALYLLAALGGSALSYLFGPVNVASVGASGAIFGVFAAYFIIARRIGADTGPIVVLLVINLAVSFADANVIDWRAHLGGLITGGLAAWLMAVVPRGRWRALGQAAALVLIGLAIVAAIAYRTSTFPA